MSLRVLGLARAPYYRWLTSPVTQADWGQVHRANALFDAHSDDPEFGYRYLHEEAAGMGVSMPGRTAWKLCSVNAWWSDSGKKRGKNGRRPGPCTTTCSRSRHRVRADRVVSADGKRPF